LAELRDGGHISLLNSYIFELNAWLSSGIINYCPFFEHFFRANSNKNKKNVDISLV
jgi:hypothetical protein